MLKKHFIFVIVSILLLFPVLLLCIYCTNYILHLKLNWNLTIPNSSHVIYKYVDTPRDGERYIILKYNNKAKIKKLDAINWNIGDVPKDFQKFFLEYAKEHHFPKKAMIDFEKNLKYYYSSQDDGSDIYLYYDDARNIIYIFENYQ